ncbi:MAG TPA: hypothetical protein VD927_06930 [Chryseosolibacter sp.]|nr:hypothetical protein [Chryseosolibacter sp.]
MFKQIFFTVCILLTSQFLFAQSVKVTKETVRLKADTAEGFEVILDGTSAEVENQLTQYLKPIGKGKKSEDAYVYNLPLINTKNYSSPVYAVVRDKGKGAVWIGVKPGEWGAGTEEISKEIEKLVHDFGVAFYKGKIQVQIDESTRALQAVERQQQRLISQKKDFDTRLTENQKEKVELERSLENNKLQFEALGKKLLQNKKEQDSIAVATEQIKKVIEAQKLKQSNIQ